jgi:hypothetical protein
MVEIAESSWIEARSMDLALGRRHSLARLAARRQSTGRGRATGEEITM